MLVVPRLADDGVRLRRFRADDVPAITRACQDPAVQLFTRVPSPYTEDDARAFVSGAAGRRAAGQSLEMAVCGRDDDRLLGAIGLIVDRHDPRRAEIGYWIAPEARGRGVAGRALALLARWAVTEGGYARLDLQAALANPASMRVAERCGFVREGTLRDAWYRGPGRSAMALFSLLPSDLGA